MMRAVVTDLVRAHGWTSSEATTAIDAIDLVGLLNPDLVVMDVALVGMSGLEAIPRIRARSPRSRIVVLSAFDQAVDLCLAVGAVAVVAKADIARLDGVLGSLSPEDHREAEAATAEGASTGSATAATATLATGADPAPGEGTDPDDPDAPDADLTDSLARLLQEHFGTV